MSQPRAAIGLDVGGTTTKGVVCDETGEILTRTEVPTPPHAVGLMDSLADVVATLEASLPAGTVLEPTVALCVPGIVDDARGVAVHSTNLGWREAPLASQLAERLGRPARLGHDVRAGGLAELRWGAAAGSSSMMFVAVGTGIATALVLDAQPVVGGGYAGESGHVLVPEPESGQPVLLEQVASASAIARRWSERTGRTAAGSLEVFTAAEEGDPVAAEVIADAVEALADVLACQLALVGPVPVVVGGGLSRAGEAVLRPLRNEIDRRLVLFDAPPVTAARLGSWAGAMGSAALGLAAAGGKRAA